VVRMSQGLGWGMGGGVARALPCAYPLEEHHSTAEIEEPYNAREFSVASPGADPGGRGHCSGLGNCLCWLCQQGRDWPVEADVWRLRQRWPEEKVQIREDLLTGAYEVGLLRRVTLQNGEEVDLWAARDAVVMKALALVLPHHLPLSPRCTHLKGHGGLKHAVQEVLAALPQHRFVLKTDVQSYYASIDHQLLLDRLTVHIADWHVLNLIGQCLRRCAERGGLYWDHQKGIALGSPLSPILGAFFLTEVDDAMEQLGLFYVRYMDDLLVLAPTRWKLRQAVKIVNQALMSLRLTKHPEKTFIGRIEKGFDFLGYHFGPEGLVDRARGEIFLER
jgi:RNA-directed DNA polymerase